MQSNDKRLVGANAVMWLFQLLYTVSPIDLIPDIIPLLGVVDDGLLFLLTVGFTAFTLHRMYKSGANPLDMLAAAVAPSSEQPVDYEPLDPVELQRL